MRVESSMNTGLKIQTYILKRKKGSKKGGQAGGAAEEGEGMLRGGNSERATQKPRDKAFKTKDVPNVYFSGFHNN